MIINSTINKTERIVNSTIDRKYGVDGKSIEADIDIANQRVGFKQEGEANFTYIDLPKLEFDDLTQAQKDSLKLTFDQLTQAEKDSLKLTFDDLTQAQKDAIFNTYLANFYSPSIIALNSRVVNEGATVARKLRFAQAEEDELQETPILFFTPSAYKAGKAYSVLPTDGSGDFTVDRNCEASYVAEDGSNKFANANEPRFDWSSGKPALLVEPQRTNLVKWSEDFSTYNRSGGVELSLNYKTTPFGINSTLVDFKEANKYFGDLNIVGYELNEFYSGSFALKGIQGETLRIRVASQEKNITLSGEWEIVKYENQLYSSTSQTSIHLNTYGGVSARKIEIVFMQLEKGSTAGSYIKTEGATKTRLKDTITVTPPAGTTQIIETIDGVEQTPITTIPATYEVSEGNINQIKML